MENGPKIKISQKMHFMKDFFVNPRPLNKNNKTKLSIVKWF